MIAREEARIGCFIFMVGSALATLSSLTGLGMIGRVGTGVTIALGVMVLAMVCAAGRVLIRGARIDSAVAVGAGLSGSLLGAILVGHMFVYAFPGFYALAALVSVACARRPGARDARPGS